MQGGAPGMCLSSFFKILAKCQKEDWLRYFHILVFGNGVPQLHETGELLR